MSIADLENTPGTIIGALINMYNVTREPVTSAEAVSQLREYATALDIVQKVRPIREALDAAVAELQETHPMDTAGIDALLEPLATAIKSATDCQDPNEMARQCMQGWNLDATLRLDELGGTKLIVSRLSDPSQLQGLANQFALQGRAGRSILSGARSALGG